MTATIAQFLLSQVTFASPHLFVYYLRTGDIVLSGVLLLSMHRSLSNYVYEVLYYEVCGGLLCITVNDKLFWFPLIILLCVCFSVLVLGSYHHLHDRICDPCHTSLDAV